MYLQEMPQQVIEVTRAQPNLSFPQAVDQVAKTVVLDCLRPLHALYKIESLLRKSMTYK